MDTKIEKLTSSTKKNDEDVLDSSIEKQSLKAMKLEAENSKTNIENRKISRNKWKISSSLTLLIVIIYYAFNKLIPLAVPNYIAISLFIFSILTLLSLSGSEDKILFEEQEASSKLVYIEEQIFTYEIEKKSFEERALQQFNRSKNEIEKYNNYNFTQLKQIFSLGRLLIIIGTLLIIAVIAYSLTIETTLSNFVYILSISGGIMINFIGTTFISMYSRILKSSSMNHYVRIENNQVYLGNLLASQIKNDELREETLSEVAKALISKEKLINYND